MRTVDEVEAVSQLYAAGLSKREISDLTGIPYSTVRNWCNGRSRALAVSGDACPACGQRCLPVREDAEAAYAHLLGLYLGDGGIYRHRRGVFRLVIFGDAAYPGIVREAARSMAMVMPHVRVSEIDRNKQKSCVAVCSYSRRWPCLFPQHGPGPKHTRPIELCAWQAAITRKYPRELIRGLIQADGCRAINTVVSKRGRRYSYVRYLFSNRSDDIRRIFCDHLDLLEIPWRRMNRVNISVARRDAVARLDEFVGPKA